MERVINKIIEVQPQILFLVNMYDTANLQRDVVLLLPYYKNERLVA